MHCPGGPVSQLDRRCLCLPEADFGFSVLLPYVNILSLSISCNPFPFNACVIQCSIFIVWLYVLCKIIFGGILPLKADRQSGERQSRQSQRGDDMQQNALSLNLSRMWYLPSTVSLWGSVLSPFTCHLWTLMCVSLCLRVCLCPPQPVQGMTTQTMWQPAGIAPLSCSWGTLSTAPLWTCGRWAACLPSCSMGIHSGPGGPTWTSFT